MSCPPCGVPKCRSLLQITGFSRGGQGFGTPHRRSRQYSCGSTAMRPPRRAPQVPRTFRAVVGVSRERCRVENRSEARSCGHSSPSPERVRARGERVERARAGVVSGTSLLERLDSTHCEDPAHTVDVVLGSPQSATLDGSEEANVCRVRGCRAFPPQRRSVDWHADVQ